MTTPIIFRKHIQHGGVIAIFPTLPGTHDPMTCACYEHVGQHSCLQKLWYDSFTRPANPDEYKDLLEELISIGYDDLKVYQKWLYWMDKERWRNCGN